MQRFKEYTQFKKDVIDKQIQANPNSQFKTSDAFIKYLADLTNKKTSSLMGDLVQQLKANPSLQQQAQQATKTIYDRALGTVAANSNNENIKINSSSADIDSKISGIVTTKVEDYKATLPLQVSSTQDLSTGVTVALTEDLRQLSSKSVDVIQKNLKGTIKDCSKLIQKCLQEVESYAKYDMEHPVTVDIQPQYRGDLKESLREAEQSSGNSDVIADLKKALTSSKTSSKEIKGKFEDDKKEYKTFEFNVLLKNQTPTPTLLDSIKKKLKKESLVRDSVLREAYDYLSSLYREDLGLQEAQNTEAQNTEAQIPDTNEKTMQELLSKIRLLLIKRLGSSKPLIENTAVTFTYPVKDKKYVNRKETRSVKYGLTFREGKLCEGFNGSRGAFSIDVAKSSFSVFPKEENTDSFGQRLKTAAQGTLVKNTMTAGKNGF